MGHPASPLSLPNERVYDLEWGRQLDLKVLGLECSLECISKESHSFLPQLSYKHWLGACLILSSFSSLSLWFIQFYFLKIKKLKSFVCSGILVPWQGIGPTPSTVEILTTGPEEKSYFWCYWKWKDFIISFSDCSLFVYRNAVDFLVLTLYPATLLIYC